MKKLVASSDRSLNFLESYESKVGKFGNGAHACLPKKWLDKYEGRPVVIFLEAKR